MKKIISIVLVLILVCTVLAACNTHECQHQCLYCEKCTDATCKDKACQDKCEGHPEREALDSYVLPQEGKAVTSPFELPKKIGDYDVVWSSDNQDSLKVTELTNFYYAEPNRTPADIEVTLTVSLGELNRAFKVNVPFASDNTEFYDAITKTLKLEREYEGRNFFTEGIGEAILLHNTDGDTTTFRLKNGNAQVTIRYACVDTPESTIGVEKWGKQASNFTAERLNNAKKIVLEGESNPPKVDSYGVRYMGYVWYMPADSDELQLLNLELIENGFSNYPSSSENAYDSYMTKAKEFADSILLRRTSPLDDPMYSDKAIEIELKDFKYEEHYNDKDGGYGDKISFNAYISAMTVSSSGTYLFTATQYYPEEGKTYSVQLFTGYASASASSYLRIGDYYKIEGTVAKHNNEYQISGIKFSPGTTSKGFTRLVQDEYYLTFNSNTEYNANFSKSLYSNVTVTKVNSVSNGLLTFEGIAYQQERAGLKAESRAFIFTVKVPSGYANTIKVGSELQLDGLQYELDSGEIFVINFQSIKIVK